MTLTAADLGLFDLFHHARAVSGDLDFAPDTQHAFLDARFKHHVGTGVGAHDGRDRAFRAQVRCVSSTVGRAIDQSTFLSFTTAVKILVVKGALGAGRGDHS